MQSLLIVSETTLTVVLLTSAGLLLRSFIKVLNANPGFNRENVLTLNSPSPAAKPHQRPPVRFVRDILQKIEQIPVLRARAWPRRPMSKPVGYFDDVASRADRRRQGDFHSGFDAIAEVFFKSSRFRCSAVASSRGRQ